VLRVFCESVGAQLRRQRRRARTISLKLRYEDFSTINRSTTLNRPVSSDDALFDAANAMLNRLRQVERRPVRLIGAGASNLVDDAVQLSLEPLRETKGEALSAAFDRVRGKYGTRSLQTGRTAFDATVRRREDLFEGNTGLSRQIER
jgi:DNA polymerase-4